MSVIKSLILAFSMYSRIPVPHVRLEEKDMKYTFGFSRLSEWLLVHFFQAGLFLQESFALERLHRCVFLVFFCCL